MSQKFWIVGASSGIGAELAKQLATQKHHITISARRQEKLDEVAKVAPEYLSTLPVDICDPQSIENTFKVFAGENNFPDTIILNAGIYTPQTAKKFSFDRAAEVMDVNYLGICRMLERILPILIARGSGKIVIVASVAGYQGLPKSLSYGPTKAALINLAEGLNIELRNTGITVQIVNPGFVKTPLTAQNKFPMPFLIDVEEAATFIRKGMNSSKFEIAFPRPFVIILKLLRLLPYRLSLPLIKRMTS